jgi:transposase
MFTAMKLPAQIHPWMTVESMSDWVRESPTLDAYKKRLAIWLTARGPVHAHRVSELLQVSKQAVWLWVKQFNQGGPDSLDRKGRGGRRRAYLTVEEERKLVAKLQSLVANGQARKAKELLPEVLNTVGQNVSVAYVYRLMQRHERRRGLRAMVNANEKGRAKDEVELENGSLGEDAATKTSATGTA